MIHHDISTLKPSYDDFTVQSTLKQYLLTMIYHILPGGVPVRNRSVGGFITPMSPWSMVDILTYTYYGYRMGPPR